MANPLLDSIARYSDREATEAAQTSANALESIGRVEVAAGRANVDDLKKSGGLAIPALMRGARAGAASAQATQMMLDFDAVLEGEGKEWSQGQWQQYLTDSIASVNTGDVDVDAMVQTQIADQSEMFLRKQAQVHRQYAEQEFNLNFRNSVQQTMRWNVKQLKDGVITREQVNETARALIAQTERLETTRRSALVADVAASMLLDGDPAMYEAIDWDTVTLTEQDQNKVRSALSNYNRAAQAQNDGFDAFNKLRTLQRTTDKEAVLGFDFFQEYVLPQSMDVLRTEHPGMSDNGIEMLARIEFWESTKRTDPKMADMLQKTLNFSVDPENPESRAAFNERMQIAQTMFNKNPMMFNQMAGQGADQFHAYMQTSSIVGPDQAMYELHQEREALRNGRPTVFDTEELAEQVQGAVKSEYHSYIPFADSVDEAARGEVQAAVLQRAQSIKRANPSLSSKTVAARAAREVGQRYVQLGDRVLYTRQPLSDVLGGSNQDGAAEFFKRLTEGNGKELTGYAAKSPVGKIFSNYKNYDISFDANGNMNVFALDFDADYQSTSISNSELRELYKRFIMDGEEPVQEPVKEKAEKQPMVWRSAYSWTALKAEGKL